MIRLTVFLLIPFFIACHLSDKQTTGNFTKEIPDSTYTPQHAQRFKIDYYKGYKILTIQLPFDSIQNKTFCIQTDTLVDIKKIETTAHISLKNHSWIALSSTHISSANIIGVKDKIIGVAEPQYISDKDISEKIKSGKIRNVGMAMMPDNEVVISLDPGFVMVSPFANISYQSISNAGIAIVPNASYMESSPLGRAEWVIAMAALFNKETSAKNYFKDVAQRYEKLTQLTAQINNKPTLFTGHLYQGIWNTSQGQNYMARFFNDAGAKYTYANTQGTGTLNLDFETILHQNANTDFWMLILNLPQEVTYDAITELDERYALFKAFKQKKIIATNAANSLFFEEGEQMPDVILADFIKALHPNLLPDYQPRFFHLVIN